MSKKANIELIHELSLAFGPTGCEDEVARLIESKISHLADSIKLDRMGNLIARMTFGNGSKKLMVSSHMDEVGFMVTEICEDGYLRFDTVGGISGSVLAGRRITLGGKDGKVNGLIASKAIHHKSKEDREKVLSAEKLHIDIGAANKEEAERYAEIGSFATFCSEFVLFGTNERRVKSKALDDRMGCAAMIEVMGALAKNRPSVDLDVYFCFTVREEIGVSGALTAANTIHPDYAIVLETTAVADLCDVDESMRVASLGSGGAISLMDRSTIYNRDFIDLALEVAKKNEIPVQVKKYVSGGNDAGHIHKSTTGVKTLALSAPTRYLHSPNCVACYDDYEHMLKLLQKLILTGELR